MTVADRIPSFPNLKPHRRTSIIVAILASAALIAVVASRPRLGLLFAQSPVIQAHVYAAVSAFVLGAVILLAQKGRAFHRIAGWGWVGLMIITAGASLFITELNGDSWSYIHILSGFTLLMVPLGVVAAKKRNIQLHRWRMTGIYIGGMLVAGAFTFVPGRLMWAIFFS